MARKRTDPVLTLERRNPLPVGYYWQDISDAQSPDFGEWLRRNRESVTIRETEGHDPAWVKFEVRAPVKWEGPGLPTVASRNTHREDTVPKTSRRGGFGREVKKLVWFGAAATAGYFGLDLFLKHRRESAKLETRTQSNEEVLE